MFHPRWAATIVAMVMLATSALPAFAHDRHGPDEHHGGPVLGYIVAYSQNNLQVQPRDGSSTVTVPYNSSTRILRIAAGSFNDIVPKAHVQLHCMDGTHTVKGIWVDTTWKQKPSKGGKPNPRPSPPSKRYDQDFAAARLIMHPFGPAPHDQNHYFPNTGAVVSLKSNASTPTITILDAFGKQWTFKLAGYVTITKILSGSVNDLDTNELVQILRAPGGMASQITILSA